MMETQKSTGAIYADVGRYGSGSSSSGRLDDSLVVPPKIGVFAAVGRLSSNGMELSGTCARLAEIVDRLGGGPPEAADKANSQRLANGHLDAIEIEIVSQQDTIQRLQSLVGRLGDLIG